MTHDAHPAVLGVQGPCQRVLGVWMVSLVLTFGAAAAAPVAMQPVTLSSGSSPSPSQLATNLSGATWIDDSLFVVRNRAPGLLLYRIDTSSDWAIYGGWAVRGLHEPDIEAVSEVPGRGLLLAVEHGELVLVDPRQVSDPPGELDMIARWAVADVPNGFVGIEGLTWIPEPAAVRFGAEAGAALYVVAGHQGTGQLRVLALAANPTEPVRASRALRVRAQGRRMSEVAGLFWDGVSVWTWHNRGLFPLGGCENRSVRIDTWNASSDEVTGAVFEPSLAGLESRCPNLEGIAMSPCQAGERTMVLTLDSPDADKGEHYLYRGAVACEGVAG